MVGPANNLYRNGRHSAYIPARMAAKYNEAQHDPELLSLHDEVALVDARIAELLGRVDTGESGAMWATLRKEWDEFKLVRASGDIPGMHRAMGRLDGLMERAIRDHLAWGEIGEEIEQRRKLVESENKHLIATQQLITTTQALILSGALVDAVTRHILEIPRALPQEAMNVQSTVEGLVKRALSAIIVDLQQIMVKDQVPVYAEATG